MILSHSTSITPC